MDTNHPPCSADNHPSSLKQIADDLLFHNESEGRLKAAATGLYSICSAVTGISENSSDAADLDETILPSGKAISPKDAASCLLDFGRTSKFLRGIHAAILEAQKRFPDTVIEILYAGCGPFAPLALPLTSRFRASEIQFTLLDTHKRSLSAARRTFQALGLTAFVRDYIQCDAARYSHAAPHAIHIVVAEAMQAALEKEPQVAITMNLAPQLCAGGIFIPEQIAVDCCLCDLAKEFALAPIGVDAAELFRAASNSGRHRTQLGPALDLTAEKFRNPLASGSSGEHHEGTLFSKVTLDVPRDLAGEFDVMLLTRITVFDSISLGHYESGLTSPKILYDLGKVRGGTRIELAYNLGNKPGFKYRSL